jgi:hypothetical protein
MRDARSIEDSFRGCGGPVRAAVVHDDDLDGFAEI